MASPSNVSNSGSSHPTLTNVVAAGSGGDSEELPNNNNNINTTTTITSGSTTVTGLPLDWTQMGATADEGLPIRYPHDVTEWSIDDTEISVVGTAGQKITVLGNDFDCSSTNNNTNKTNPNLTSLILRSHLIKEMKGLGSLKHLTTLELYDNMVQSFDEDSMKGCGPNLHVLDMSYNAIRDMTPVKFCSPVHLTELYVANNKLKTIAGLSGLTNLRKLDLGANRIRIMDSNELSGLINLEELWIGKNKIEQIDGLEKVCVIMTEVDSICLIHRCDRLKTHFKLTHPFLSFSLISFPSIILKQLTKLRRLDIQSNRLTRIENLEGQVETLEELYLSHNGIDDDGASMTTGLALKFNKLNMLDLSRNRLTTTSMFVHLSTLEELWLSGNEMESFDAVEPLRDASSAGQLPSLETIYLEYNPLASDFEYRKKLAEWIPSLQQIDATLIGGLAAHGMAPTGAAARVVGTSSGSGGGGLATEEQLRHLQAAAIERARQQQQQQQAEDQKTN